MPDLTASIPHQMSKEEAKRRVQEHIRILREQHAAMISEIQENWSGDTLAFAVRSMGQSITGRLTVDDQMLHLTVALPWLLRMLAGSVKRQLEHQGRLLLAPPK